MSEERETEGPNEGGEKGGRRKAGPLQLVGGVDIGAEGVIRERKVAETATGEHTEGM